MSSDFFRRFLTKSLLMLVGVVSVLACVLGGVTLVAVVVVEHPPGSEPGVAGGVGTTLLFLGGLAGLWGSQRLSAQPGVTTRTARVAAACGVVAFVTFVLVIFTVE